MRSGAEWAGPATGVRIALAGFEHLDDLAALWAEMAAEKPKAQPLYWKEQTRGLMEAGKYLGVLAHAAGTPLGFADAQVEFDAADAQYLALGRTLFVRPVERGTGLGAALMQGILALARQKGCVALVTHGRPSRRLAGRTGLACSPFAEYVRMELGGS